MIRNRKCSFLCCTALLVAVLLANVACAVDIGIINGDFELDAADNVAPPTGWTDLSTATSFWTGLPGEVGNPTLDEANLAPDPGLGTYFLTTARQSADIETQPETGQLVQTVDLSTFGTQIDAGNQFLFVDFIWASDDNRDTGDFSLHFFDSTDGTGTELGAFNLLLDDGDGFNFVGWFEESVGGSVPVSTRSVTLQIDTMRTGGSETNLWFDNVTGDISAVLINQWNVDGGGSFNTPGNWVNNEVPTDDALFGNVLTPPNAPATVTLDNPVSLNKVTFQNGNQYILAGPAVLTLVGDHEVSVSNGTHQITADIAGTAGLVKTGTGTLILPNANSYTGATDVQAGTLVLNNLDAIDNQASSVLNIESEAETVLLSTGATGTLAAELTGIGTLQLSADLEPTDTITLNRSNATFDGLIDVDDGILAVTHNNALGVGGNSFNRTLVAGLESTGKVVLPGNVTINNEVLELGARENAGFEEVHLTSTGNNAWNGHIVGVTGGTQYNIESTSGTLTLGGMITAPDTNPRNFVFAGDGNTTITGALSDSTIDVDTGLVTPSVNDNVSVVKRGAGTLTIATGTDDIDDFWFGPTVIEEGTLTVIAGGSDAGELQSLDVTIREGATLNVSSFGNYSQQFAQIFRGSGEINVGSGTLGLFDDASLAPGDSAGAVGSLDVTGNVSLSSFAAPGNEGTWSFDVGNSTDTSGDMLAVSGGFTASGSPALIVNVTPAHGHLDAGARTIVSHSGGAVSAVNGIAAQITDAAGNPLVTRQTVAISGNTAGQVNVVVTGEEAARTWNGNVSGVWDVATTNNWQEGDQQYQDLDRVTFNDMATGTSDVTVDGPRYAAAVNFANSTKEYTLSGSGGVAGTGSLNVTGTGQVTLANTGNNYSGATTIASGSSLRMTAATTGDISNSGTLSLGVTTTTNALVQDGSHTIGTNNNSVFAVEAENFNSSTINNSEVVVWEALADANASAGQALIATTTADDNLDTNLANQNYVTYGLKFTEPGEYFFYGRIRGEDHGGDGSTADDDSLWLPATDLGNGVTDSQALSTKYDGDQGSSARNAEGATSGGELFDFDWYISSGQNDGFDRIVVTPDDVTVGTVFQFRVATRESGGVFDKFVFVQDPDFVTDPNFGTITDTDLDNVQVITDTTVENVLLPGTILNVNGDFTMSGDNSVLNMNIGAPSVHDQMNVSGNLAADGILNIETGTVSIGAQAGDLFDIFSFASASGAFDNIILPDLAPGLDWDTSSLLVTGELLVVSLGLPGDYNENGVVDTADYAVWLAHLGSTDTLPNDLIGGVVGAAQYNQWKGNFGNTFAAGAGSADQQSVPEPTTFAMFLIAVSIAAAKVFVQDSRNRTIPAGSGRAATGA